MSSPNPFPSSPSSSSSSSTSPTSPAAEVEEAARKQQAAAAAQRFAEVSLKSVPLPEGVDPNARATVGEAVRTIKPEDFTRVHLAPCTREGLLTGLGAGGVFGFLRYIVGAPVPKAANWAVGSGVVASILAYEYCQVQRRIERANMKRVVEVVTQKQAEQKRLEDEKKQRRQQEEAEAAGAAAARRGGSWYKFW